MIIHFTNQLLTDGQRSYAQTMNHIPKPDLLMVIYYGSTLLGLSHSHDAAAESCSESTGKMRELLCFFDYQWSESDKKFDVFSYVYSVTCVILGQYIMGKDCAVSSLHIICLSSTPTIK